MYLMLQGQVEQCLLGKLQCWSAIFLTIVLFANDLVFHNVTAMLLVSDSCLVGE